MHFHNFSSTILCAQRLPQASAERRCDWRDFAFGPPPPEILRSAVKHHEQNENCCKYVVDGLLIKRDKIKKKQFVSAHTSASQSLNIVYRNPLQTHWWNFVKLGIIQFIVTGRKVPETRFINTSKVFGYTN